MIVAPTCGVEKGQNYLMFGILSEIILTTILFLHRSMEWAAEKKATQL